MSNVFDGLEPKEVLNNFYKISQSYSRRADNCQGVSDFMTAFGRNLGLETFQDETGNVIIWKPATPGYEKAPTVMLEGHMDMICAANIGVTHDFDNEPIRILVDEDGDTVRADGTTLGADDGLGVAMIMSVLESKTIEHPALEAVFTVNEETDMKGALNVHYEKLHSKVILSLDGDRLALGGGGELEMEMFLDYSRIPAEADTVQAEISISGLIGGHSGKNAYIERGNAVTLLVRMLSALQKKMPFRLTAFTGGDFTACAFARDSFCSIVFPKEYAATVEQHAAEWQELYSREMAVQDPDVRGTLTWAEKPADTTLDDASTERFINFITILPDGICSIHKYFEKKYESCVNVGVVEMPDDREFRIITCIRSAMAAKKYFQYDKILRICALTGVRHGILHDLPQWEFNANSRAAEIARKVYDDLEPAIGGGTCEMGIFLDNLPGSEAVGVGPVVNSPHSPNECFSIKMMEKDWKRLIQLLKELKNY